jgi:GST-like protein
MSIVTAEIRESSFPTLVAARGSGSVIVELAAAYCGFVMQNKYYKWEDVAGQNNPVKEVNPLGQVPTLVLPSGTVITESGAIISYINEICGSDLFLKNADAQIHASCLRWFFVITSAIYPTFTFSDFPDRFVFNKEEQKNLTQAAIDRRCQLYKAMDEFDAEGPHFFGQHLSVVDFYLAVMVFWRPGFTWFKEHCPRLWAIASEIHRDERFAPTLRANELL